MALYVADANGTPYPLVALTDCPTDGTWEVMHASGSGGYRWATIRGKIEGYYGLLVVARPIGSDV